MKEVPLVEWARRLIDDQLERLSELRNANPRDPGFKLWRQTTLTVIQRIWPGDLARCERFRRIPFSSTSPRVTRAQIRENFERGCAEASAYLKILTLELETQGLSKPPMGAPEPKPASLPEDLANPAKAAAIEPPFDPRDMFEPSPFDRIQPTPQAAAAAQPADPVPAPDPAPRVEDSRPSRPAPEPARAVEAPISPQNPVPSSTPTPPRAVTPTPARPAGPPNRGPRRPGRQQLKEMLGFIDEPPQKSVPPAATGSAPAVPARPATPPANPAAPAAPPKAATPPARPVAPAAPPRPANPPVRPTPPPPAAREVEPPPPSPAAVETPGDEEPKFALPIPPLAFFAEEEPDEVEPDEAEPDLEEMMAEAEQEAFDRERTARDPSTSPGDLAIEFLSRPPRPVTPAAPPIPTSGGASASAERMVSETRGPAPVMAHEVAPINPGAPRSSIAVTPALPSEPERVEAPEPEPALAPMPEPFLASEPEPFLASESEPVPASLEAEDLEGSISPTAAALMALAGQLDRLGVPEGQCAATRAALVDLARQLDEGIASFDSIREILWIVADYPVLARRSIPLLIPFLDLE